MWAASSYVYHRAASMPVNACGSGHYCGVQQAMALRWHASSNHRSPPSTLTAGISSSHPPDLYHSVAAP